jgi:hypothetical protein
MNAEDKGNNKTRPALTLLAKTLLQHYDVTRPPVPIEQMLKEPPAGLAGVDFSKISFIMEHGLYSYEPRLAMARLLCREIAQHGAATEPFGIEVSCTSYTDLKYFARCLLMPSNWVEAMTKQNLSIEQISTHLQTPSHAVVTRLIELGLPVLDKVEIRAS